MKRKHTTKAASTTPTSSPVSVLAVIDAERNRLLHHAIRLLVPLHCSLEFVCELEYELMSVFFGLDVLSTLAQQRMSWVRDERRTVYTLLRTMVTDKCGWRELAARWRTIIYNCRNSLFLREQRGKRSARWLASASHRDMWPERWASPNAPALPTPEELATTSEFRCEACNERTTRFFQLQIRSADEPMTTFIECTTCHNRWKLDDDI